MATVTDSREQSTATQSSTVPTHRLTVDRYLRMVAAGIFKENEPIFLWNGRLAEKLTKGTNHNFTLTELDAMLFALIPAGWHIRPEQPIQIRDDGMPEPDLTIVRGKNREPTGPSEAPSYRERRFYGPAERVPVAFDGREVGHVVVDEFLPWDGLSPD